jgi:chlorobactene glucosyltransferase
MPPWFWLSTAFCIAGLAIIEWIHAQAQLGLVVEPSPTPSEPPLVSLIVPARNEEANIRCCVESLLAQTYPCFEVIVVDDRSSDATPAILAGLARQDSRLTVLPGSELPHGWAGKPHALLQAAGVAQGEWLVFIDADTWLEPDALTATLARALQTGADLFTTLHTQVMATFWEKTVLPLVLLGISVGFPPRRVNDPHRPQAIANGQYLMIRRSVYEAVGGHAAVRSAIVEDKELALVVKKRGFKLLVADGRDFVSTRMYTSLAEMWEGWTKNIFLGLRDQRQLLGLGAFAVLLALLAAFFMPVWPLLGLAWLRQGGGWMALCVLGESLLVWAYLLFKRTRASAEAGISGWYALTVPLGAAVFAGMMLVSTWKVLSGRGVTWKGRTYR